MRDLQGSDITIFKAFIDNGWNVNNNVLYHKDFKFTINLNSYPIVQVLEEGKAIQSYHGLNIPWLIFKENGK